jgi:hypothetical protein
MDVSSSHYAYVHKEINKEDTLVELKKQLDESILAKNVFIKDAADQALTLGHKFIQGGKNLINVTKAYNGDEEMQRFQQHFSEEIKFEQMAAQANEIIQDESFQNDKDIKLKNLILG